MDWDWDVESEILAKELKAEWGLQRHLSPCSHTTSAAVRLGSKFETWAGEERGEYEDLCGRDVDHC